MSLDLRRGLAQQRLDQRRRRDVRLPKGCRVQLVADPGDRMDGDPPRDVRLVAGQASAAAAAARSPGLSRRSSAAPVRPDGGAPRRPPGAARRSSCRCRPSRRCGLARCNRARQAAAAPDAERRPICPTGNRARAPVLRYWSAPGSAAARRDVRTDRPRPECAAATPGVPPVASSNSASAASCGRRSAMSNSVSSVAWRTSFSHSGGTP